MKATKSLSVGSVVGCLLLVGSVLGAGCSETEDVKPDPSASISPTAKDAGSEQVREWTCPQGVAGAKMVLIAPSKGDPYCIDEREAVYAEYKQFLDVKGGDLGGQPPECELNDSYVPGWEDEAHEIPECSSWLIDSEPDRAVNCLDFCDAWAFCAWAGKRLCGVRGADPGKVTMLEPDEVGQVGRSVESEWFDVCSQGGTTEYPYGDSYEAGKCIDADKVAAEGSATLNVRDTEGNACHGEAAPYSAVYNMSGSLRQWVNLCRTSGCLTVGGTPIKARSCGDESLGVGSRLAVNVEYGVRCCADAVSAPVAAH